MRKVRRPLTSARLNNATLPQIVHDRHHCIMLLLGLTSQRLTNRLVVPRVNVMSDNVSASNIRLVHCEYVLIGDYQQCNRFSLRLIVNLLQRILQ